MQQKSRVWMFFVALAGLCWGVYVPLIAEGGKELHSAFAAFLCVGGAYFPARGAAADPSSSARAARRPAWNGRGISLSTLAGVAGAVGALCVVFATVVFRGRRCSSPRSFSPWRRSSTPSSASSGTPTRAPFTVGAPREPVHWSLYLGVVLAGLGAALVLLAKDLPGVLAGTKTDRGERITRS